MILRVVFVTDEAGIRWAFLYLVEQVEEGIVLEYALPGDAEPVALIWYALYFRR